MRAECSYNIFYNSGMFEISCWMSDDKGGSLPREKSAVILKIKHNFNEGL